MAETQGVHWDMLREHFGGARPKRRVPRTYAQQQKADEDAGARPGTGLAARARGLGAALRAMARNYSGGRCARAEYARACTHTHTRTHTHTHAHTHTHTHTHTRTHAYVLTAAAAPHRSGQWDPRETYKAGEGFGDIEKRRGY